MSFHTTLFKIFTPKWFVIDLTAIFLGGLVTTSSENDIYLRLHVSQIMDENLVKFHFGHKHIFSIKNDLINLRVTAEIKITDNAAAEYKN